MATRAEHRRHARLRWMDDHGAAHGGTEVFVHLHDNPHYSRDCEIIKRLLADGTVRFSRDTGVCFVYEIIGRTS